MTSWLLPIGATALAAVVTYWCCVRPMRKDHHGTAPLAARGCCPPSQAAEDLGEQIKQTTAERDRLRAESPSQGEPGQRSTTEGTGAVGR